MTRRVVTLLAALLVAAVASAQAGDGLARAVEACLKADGMAHATVSVCVYDAAKGLPLYAHDAQRALPAASVQKVLATGVALSRLGAGHRFTTRLLMQGEVDRDGVLHGDLVIVGGGDPLLGSYRYKQTSHDSLFARWTAALKSRGVRRVDGRVAYDASIFTDANRHDTWQHGDVGNYYGSGASGLTFHENMYFVYFGAGSAVGEPASVVRTAPKNMSLVEDCRVLTGQAGSGDQVVVYGLEDSRERLYTGTVPLGSRDFPVRASLPCPPRTCADLFAVYLRQHGVSVGHEAAPAASPAGEARTVSEYSSPELHLIARYTNQTSNNVYAECLFKYLGHTMAGEGSFDGGARAVEQWLDGHGVERGGVRIVDGSGLSRLNTVTTDFLCRYLAVMHREPCRDVFVQSLRSSSTQASHRYKTGSMDGLRAQAGYLVAHGRTLAYAVIITGYACPPDKAKESIDNIVAAMGGMQ